jgi:hypothetical protein
MGILTNDYDRRLEKRIHDASEAALARRRTARSLA